jgi:acetyltransferase-like isoleucine patch superfamily enzyme
MIAFIKKIINKNMSRKIENQFKAIGENVKFDLSTKFIFPERLFLGKHIYIGPKGLINAMGDVDINDGSIIGPNVVILSANHNFKECTLLPYDEEHIFKKVYIDCYVWIGANVIITPGSVIGEGSIIGAGAVISGTIPPLSIVVGNPCKVIGKRNSEKYFELKNAEKCYLKEKMLGNIVPNFAKIESY